MEIDSLALSDKGKTSIGFLPKAEMIIDWFQFTIFPNEKSLEKILIQYDKSFISQDRIIPLLFKMLFKVDSINIIRETTKLNGYDVVYSYNNIKIMLNSTRDDMGINVLLSGQACRDYEELGLDWFDLFKKINEFDFNLNRIDIALDSFTDKYFTLNKVYDYIINGNVSTRFRSTFEMKKRDLDKNLLLGDTIQFGSKASQVEITFYNKLLERESAGRIVDEDIKHWYRCELRFRHESALAVFQEISNNDDYSNYILEILYYYIDFKNPYSKDSNKCRRPTVGWWKEFIGSSSKLKLSRKSSETSITKKYNWLLSSISKSEMMVYFSKLNNFKLDVISTDLLYEMITRGLSKIEEKDMMMINDHRILNKLEPITKSEILDYIQSLKDYLI